MMNVLFCAENAFFVATIVSESSNTLHVMDSHAKHSKIKQRQVFWRFNGPLEGLMTSAIHEQSLLDSDTLWQSFPREAVHFSHFAYQYYGASIQNSQMIGLAMKLHQSPMYFRRKGQGVFSPASDEEVSAMKISMLKKVKLAEQKTLWTNALLAHTIPDGMHAMMDMMLYGMNKVDKHSVAYQALMSASEQAQVSPLMVLQSCGAIPSAHEFHMQSFLYDYPIHQEAESPPINLAMTHDMPTVTSVQAFSIDSISTTEIDDAFSVEFLSQGVCKVGIHIATPTLGVIPHSPCYLAALKKLSTVYTPTCKFTLFPHAVIDRFSLNAQTTRPVLSLYLYFNEDHAITARETRLEQISIQTNLRYENFSTAFNQHPDDKEAHYPYAEELATLWQLSRHLKQLRSAKLTTPQTEYSISVDHDETVHIATRTRGAPLDSLVEEFMIEANRYWASCLAKQNIPSIYRTQSAQGKVVSKLYPAQHHDLGVAQYAWCTSPLRRMVDWVNQYQLLVWLGDIKANYLEQPLLSTVVQEFDALSLIYQKFQHKMERFWCLRYIQQNKLKHIQALVIRDDIVCLHQLPLISKVCDLPMFPPNTSVLLAIECIDLLQLSIQLKFVDLVKHVKPVPSILLNPEYTKNE